MVRFISDSRPLPVLSAESDSASGSTSDIKKAGLQVIVAGMPRAASSSVQAAIEALGFDPCLHMAHILPHTERSRLLLEAARAKQDPAVSETQLRGMLRRLIGGYRGVADLPVLYFTPDFMDMFPDAVVVLNGRPSAEIWARSAMDSFSFYFSDWFYWVGFWWQVDTTWYRLNMQAIRYFSQRYGLDGRDRNCCFTVEAYERYYADVLREVERKGRPLLEFKAEDGWAPLCEFLGKEVPKVKVTSADGAERYEDMPFPRVNERETFKTVRHIVLARGLAAWAVFAGASWVAWRFGPRFVRGAASWAGQKLA